MNEKVTSQQMFECLAKLTHAHRVELFEMLAVLFILEDQACDEDHAANAAAAAIHRARTARPTGNGEANA